VSILCRLQKHRPAATSRRSLQACIASLPLQSSLMSKTYLESDHFNGAGPVCSPSAKGVFRTKAISARANRSPILREKAPSRTGPVSPSNSHFVLRKCRYLPPSKLIRHYADRSEKRPRRSGAKYGVYGRRGSALPQRMQSVARRTVPVITIRNSDCDLAATKIVTRPNREVATRVRI
jgi:hypothetical protein